MELEKTTDKSPDFYGKSAGDAVLGRLGLCLRQAHAAEKSQSPFKRIGIPPCRPRVRIYTTNILLITGDDGPGF